MTTIVHNQTFRPYAEKSGPAFNITTWYEGVTIAAGGQSGVKLGYRLTMDDAVIFETKKEADLYRPNSKRPLEGPHAVADLLSNLTSVFQVIGAIEALSTKDQKSIQRAALLERYLEHATALWDCVVAFYGEDVANPAGARLS